MKLAETRIPAAQTHLRALQPDLALVMERVRLLARRRAAWLDFLQEEADTSKEPLEDRDDPVREAQWLANYTPELNARLAEIVESLQGYPASRLNLLAHIFGLSPLDREIFQICLALALDPTLGSVLAYLHGRRDRAYLTADLIARLLGLGRTLLWPANSPLKSWRLIEELETAPGEPALLACDPQVRDWLLGGSGLHPALVGLAELRSPLTAPDSWPVAKVADFVARVTGEDNRGQAWVEVVGQPGSGRRTLAACVASQVGLPLLAVDVDAIPDQDWEMLYAILQRQAFLEGWALAWCGEHLPARRWPTNVSGFPVQFAIATPGQVIPIPTRKSGHQCSDPAFIDR